MACCPSEKDPLTLKVKKVSFGMRHPKGSTNSEKLGLSGGQTHPWVPWQPRTHLSEPRAFLPAYRREEPLAYAAAQLDVGVLASDQASPGEPTRGASNQHRHHDSLERNSRGKRVRKAGCRLRFTLQIPL